MTERPPVLSFITSLRHPSTTDDYASVVRLLDDTLRSLDAQLDRRFEVVVATNEPYVAPAGLGFPVTTVPVSFEPPAGLDGTKSERETAIKLDKGLKLAVAMSRSRGTHVMCLDSDDFVSRRIVRHVGDHTAESDGWYVERGLRYDVPSGLFRPQKNFNDVCGTSLVWRRDLMPDVELSDDPAAADVLAAYGREVVTEELGSHRSLRRRYDLRPLPFAGAVYAVHGHNHAAAASLRLGLPIGRRRAAEFGITPPPAAVTRRALAAQLRPDRVRELATGALRRVRG